MFERKKYVPALVAVLSTLLLPAMAVAQEQAKKPAPTSGGGGPFGMVLGYLRSAWNWVSPALMPDMEWEYWWIVLITFPLTLAWMWLASQGVRKFFNDVGGMVVFGSLAFIVLMGFVGPFLGIAFVIIGMVTGLIGLSMNLSFRGLLSTVWSIIKMIPFFFVVWLITKIPGLQGLIERWIGLGKNIASRIWAQHEKVKANPNLFWTIVGGLVIALLINGRFVMHLTNDMAFSGLIPAVSGATGLFFLLYRTFGGAKLRSMVNPLTRIGPLPADHPDYPLGWRCPNYGVEKKFVPLIDKKTGEVKRGRTGKKLRKIVKKKIKCGWLNSQETRHCKSPTCDHPNPYWQVCTECGYAGEDGKGFPRKPGEQIKCPSPTCDKVHLALPETTGFHDPSKDISHDAPASGETTVGASAPTPAPTMPVELGFVELTLPDMGSCPHCDAFVDLSNKGCTKCGRLFASATANPASPAEPAARSYGDEVEVRPMRLQDAWNETF